MGGGRRDGGRGACVINMRHKQTKNLKETNNKKRKMGRQAILSLHILGDRKECPSG